jgi:hypothetical protein
MYILGKEYKDQVQRLFRNCYELHENVISSLGVNRSSKNFDDPVG